LDGRTTALDLTPAADVPILRRTTSPPIEHLEQAHRHDDRRDGSWP
jgi:hypothetical protein